MIKDSGERTEFSTGAVRDMKDGKGRFDLLPWYGIMEVSKHCEEGAKKYGEHNVDRGIPLHSLMDSASRHLAKFIAGERDEDHLRAAAWNILWALNQRTTHPELNDMYWAKNEEGQASSKDSSAETKSKDMPLTYSQLRKMNGQIVWVTSILRVVSQGKHKVFVFGNDKEGMVKLKPIHHTTNYDQLVLTGDNPDNFIDVYALDKSEWRLNLSK